MDGTQSDTKQNTRRSVASKRLLVVLGLVGLVLVSGVVLADVPSNVTEESSWNAWDDFEDDTAQGWDGPGSAVVVNQSFEDNKSIEGESDVFSNGHVVDWSSDNEDFYYRWKMGGFNTGGMRLEMDETLNDGDSYLQIENSAGGDLEVLTVDSNSNQNTLATVNGFWESDGGSPWWDVYVDVHPNETIDIYAWKSSGSPPSSPTVSANFSGTFSGSDGQLAMNNVNSPNHWDEVGYSGTIPESGFDGYVLTDTDNDPIENASVNVSQGGSEVANTTTNETGWYQVNVGTGDYNISASKSGYIAESHDNVTVTEGNFTRQNFTLLAVNQSLEIDARRFMRHDTTIPYEVTWATDRTASGNLQRRTITDDDTNLTVESNDTNALTVNNDTNRFVSTSDRSVNKIVTVTANYTWEGSTYNTTHNVTVANVTVSNFGILPPWARLEATISPGSTGGSGAGDNDHSFMLIMIATFTAVAGTLLMSTFVGLGAFCIIIITGWLMGMTGAGLMLVVLTIVGFAGLNLAANIDYAVT